MRMHCIRTEYGNTENRCSFRVSNILRRLYDLLNVIVQINKILNRMGILSVEVRNR